MSSKTVNVVVLCGGFGARIVLDALRNTSTSHDASLDAATSSGLRRTVLLGPRGAERAIPVLSPVFGKKSGEYLLRACEGVRRLMPLAGCVYFVINEIDKPLFVSPEGSLFAEVSDLGLTSANIISNGARTPSEWQGPLADLHTALQTLGTGLPVVAISGSLLFMPGFNMQRIIEHSLIRDRDTIMVSTLSDTDEALLQGTDATVCTARTADAIPVPPLAEVSSPEPPRAGSTIADPLMVLKASTLPAAMQIMQQMGAHELPALAKALLAQGVTVCAVDAGQGRYRLESAQSLDYADRLMGYYLHNMAPSKTLSADDEVAGADGAAPATLNSLYAPVLEDTTRLLRTLHDFDTVYFGGEGSLLSATGGGVNNKNKYKLPSTFYMTAYRRMAAEVMR